MITGTVVGAEEAIERLERLGPRLRDVLAAEVERIGLKLAAHVKADKLSGQVLNVRSGRLRRSITARTEVEGSKVIGIVGTNVEYAAFHEYGFQGTEGVREHFRRCKSGKVAAVRAHERKVDYPAHSFLRSALEDMKDEIKGRIGAAVREAAEG
jgi:phage gpG-like protein